MTTPATPYPVVINITYDSSFSEGDFEQWIITNSDVVEKYLWHGNNTDIMNNSMFISYDNILISHEYIHIPQENAIVETYAAYIPILPNASYIKGYIVRDEIVRYVLDGCSHRYPASLCVREINHVTANYRKIVLTKEKKLYEKYDDSYPKEYIYYYTYYPEGRPSMFKGYYADRERRTNFYLICAAILISGFILYQIFKKYKH